MLLFQQTLFINVAKARSNNNLSKPLATRLPDGQEADGNKTVEELILLPFTLVNSLPRLIRGFVNVAVQGVLTPFRKFYPYQQNA